MKTAYKHSFKVCKVLNNGIIITLGEYKIGYYHSRLLAYAYK
jgi:hypothetical protein